MSPRPKKVKVSGFNAANCICTTFWDPHEYGEIVEYQGEHWHFSSDLPWSNGERGPGVFRQEKGTQEMDQRRQGVSFTREEIKHGN